MNMLKPNSLLLVSLIVFSSAVGFSQTPTPTPAKLDDPNDVIKVTSRLIIVPTSVTDAQGNAVQGLTTNDFRLLEEGKNQTIESVSPGEKVPLEIALLFDVSASTDSMFNYELDTAARFLAGVMRPEDRASVFTIGQKATLVQPRDTADKAVTAIKALQPTKGFTAFYDTVTAAADYLRQNAPERSRRVIVVISDGEDNNSTHVAKALQEGYRKLGDKINTMDSKTLYAATVQNNLDASLAERQRVLKLLQDADTVFYSVNPGGGSYQLNKISLFGQENMERFAIDTGGTAYAPKFQSVDNKVNYDNATNTRLNNEMLDRIFRQLGSELRSQYLVQYYSEPDYANGKFVKLDLTVPTHPGVKVRARQGYYVKN